MASNVDGLVSGMDTTTIISQLMQLERQPVVRLEARKTQVNAVIAIYQQLNTKFAALSSAGSALARTSDWQAMKASSSDTGAVTATATSSAQPGSLSFTVAQLSRAGAVASSGTVVSPNVVVTSGPFLVSKGADLLGFAQLEAGTGLSLGAHTVEVTQSSAGAVKDGASPVAAGFAFTGPATIGVEVDGVADTWQLSGTYASAAELAAAVESASGGAVTASLDESGALRLESAHEGSAATLRVTSVGAEAATALGLTVDGAAASGTDGYVSVDGAAAVAVSSVKAGQATSFAGGTLQAVFAGGLRAGTVAATNVDTGTGTLEALVAAVNRAGAGVSAVAVRVGTDSYRLQLSSTTTGAGSNVTVGAGDLSGLGSFTTVQAGRDAKIVIGEGPGAYEVSSATDTVAGVLDGVTFSLQRADPGTSVTVAVARDGEALAERVKALVDAANGALTHIKSHSGYDPATNKAGALLSDGKARLLTDQVLRAVSDAVGQSSLASAGRAGVSVARDGSVTFDRAKFLEAYAADPEAVEALFQQGGTATSSAVSFVSATAKAQAGTYAVDITTAAEQARIVGTDLAGSPLAGSETISVRVGGASGTTVSYSAQAGSTLADVVDGLNAAFAGGGLALTATIEGGALAILTAAYGTAAG
ncbi:MAG TPA: flagellar filament capping protein FliD, partial [Acidimicrobiia bacterium]|nr:flagellar filament capping protein FliD [Acidimicrobiia bacterium]